MQEKRIYLAAPFYDINPEIRWDRYCIITRITADLMKDGAIVFSPITHSYYLAERYGCPNSSGFWERWYLTFLEHWATILYILKLPGWDKSTGVAKEIEYANQKGLPIIYLEYK